MDNLSMRIARGRRPCDAARRLRHNDLDPPFRPVKLPPLLFNR